MRYLGVTACLSIALVVPVAACSAGGASDTAAVGSTDTAEAGFESRLESMCTAVGEATAAVRTASSRSGSERLAAELLEAQRLFVQ
jgi:hypothetical protein